MANYKVVSKFNWSGNVVLNVFYFSCDSVDPVQVTDTADQWVQDMFGQLTTNISNQLQGVTNEVYQRVALDWVIIGIRPFVFQTNVLDDPLPRQCAATITGRTSLPRVTGRKFIAGLTESQQSAGFISALTLISLRAFGDKWTQQFDGAETLIPGVWHEASGVIAPFVAMRANEQMGTQRRRKLGSGI